MIEQSKRWPSNSFLTWARTSGGVFRVPHIPGGKEEIGGVEGLGEMLNPLRKGHNRQEQGLETIVLIGILWGTHEHKLCTILCIFMTCIWDYETMHDGLCMEKHYTNYFWYMIYMTYGWCYSWHVCIEIYVCDDYGFVFIYEMLLDDDLSRCMDMCMWLYDMSTICRYMMWPHVMLLCLYVCCYLLLYMDG